MTMRRKTLIGCVVAILVLGAVYIFSPYDNLPTSIKWSRTIYMGKMIFAEILGDEEEFKEESDTFGKTYRLLHIQHWQETGISLEHIQTALDNMRESNKPRFKEEYDTIADYGPGNWVYEFETIGDVYAEKGRQAEQNGDINAATDNHLKASMYYKTATFPGIFETWWPNHREVANAYNKSLAHYERAGSYFDRPLEKVHVRLDGSGAMGYLHLPSEAKHNKVPAVLLTNGTDFFMVELYPLVQKLNQRGIAVLTFDLPGIGASREIPLTPEGDRLHAAFLDVLEKHPRIDADRLGAIGKSFGGFFSSRLAFTQRDRLKAVVNYCGPVEQISGVSTEVALEEFPAMPVEALWSRFKTESSDLSGFGDRLAEFGLVSTGVIQEGERTEVPIFSINTHSDPINPVWEMELLTRISEGGEMVIAPGEGHCPGEESPQTMVDWVVEKLGT